jgi:hypothetical protein
MSPSILGLDRARCASDPNFPENIFFRECRRALITGIRGVRADRGRSPSIFFGKVSRSDLPNVRNP